MDTKKLLFYSQQTIDSDDINEVVKALKSELITTGPYVEKFEKKIAKLTGSKYAVACSSGTAALIMAYKAIDNKNYKRVLVPSMTFVGTANAAKILGFSVDFVDCNESNGLISIEDLESKLKKKKYDLVVPVHLNGRASDLEKIYYLSKKYKFKIIDDASHALGTEYVNSKGEKSMIGSCFYTDMTTFSFHPVKNITMGEGGVITTNNKKFYETLVKLRNHGIEKEPKNLLNKELAFSSNKKINPWYYEVNQLGFNFRSSDINCALGYSQLKKLNSFKSKRIYIIKLYEKYLKNSDLVEIVSSSSIKGVSWHLLVLKIKFNLLKIDRSKLMKELLKKNIRTQVHYIPVHLMPLYKKNKINLKGTVNYYDKILSFPLFPRMENKDVKYVVKSLQNILKVFRK